MASYDLATKFATKVDEKFTRESLAGLVTNNDYEWNGVETVKVYSIPTVKLHKYSRTGTSRYGTPDELGNSTQTLTITQDRSFTYTIDKGNKMQSQMVNDAGKSISRETSLEVIPEYDAYVFGRIALNAKNYNSTSATKSNAYELLLTAQEYLGNANVPDSGRVALVSYAFSGLLKQDPAFMRDCDTAQNMQIKGMLGEVDGLKVIRVPAARLPKGCQFIVTHPMATVAPKQLSEYKIHTDAPGISGWLCEGRYIYDAFVLDNKKDAIYYCGPMSATAQTVCLNAGETYDVHVFNYTTSISATSSSTSAATVAASGDKVTITGVAAGTTTVTISDAASTAHTTTVAVTVL